MANPIKSSVKRGQHQQHQCPMCTPATGAGPACTVARWRTVIFQIFPVRTPSAAKQMPGVIFQNNLESLYSLLMFHKSSVACEVPLK